jgi:5-methyltetrahydrofolate--homocysteine methyltransferase
MTFETTPRGPHTIMGDGAPACARELEDAGAAILGVNCGTGPETMLDMVRALRRETALPILVQPNAGLPILRGADLFYPESPEGMAAYVPKFIEAGASIVGGCCGTTADHIRAIAAAVLSFRTHST